MKTKEEVIKDAWGDYWINMSPELRRIVILNSGSLHLRDFIKEFGFEDSFLYKFEVYQSPLVSISLIIPKSLQGIDNNNGWIKIEGEEDLPKENDNYWVRYKSGEYSMASYVHNSLFIKDWISKYTHYQPIVKPKLPIY